MDGSITYISKKFSFSANTTQSDVYTTLKSSLNCSDAVTKTFSYVIGRFADSKYYTILYVIWDGYNFVFTYKEEVADYIIQNVSTPIWNKLDIEIL